MPELKLTSAQKHVVELQDLHSLLTEEDRGVALSLRGWFIRHGDLTEAQSKLAKAIINRAKNAGGIKIGRAYKYWLYAFSDGENVKIGFSSNIESRLKAIQTSHHKPLSEVWRFYAGINRQKAKSMEGKLHRLCRKHKLRGEWFGVGCLEVIKTFTDQRRNSIKI